MLKKRISMLLVAVMIITGIPCMPQTVDKVVLGLLS